MPVPLTATVRSHRGTRKEGKKEAGLQRANRLHLREVPKETNRSWGQKSGKVSLAGGGGARGKLLGPWSSSVSRLRSKHMCTRREKAQSCTPVCTEAALRRKGGKKEERRRREAAASGLRAGQHFQPPSAFPGATDPLSTCLCSRCS